MSPVVEKPGTEALSAVSTTGGVSWVPALKTELVQPVLSSIRPRKAKKTAKTVRNFMALLFLHYESVRFKVLLLFFHLVQPLKLVLSGI